ncbi:hypothetical protein [Flavobacterium sp. PL002]|uniref:hypothetical protein n=1 Tax=Flavobacterium sp. PL002 TaxID=1897058 RepID=UPI001787CD96|nr:hypothetical protein [Flavobacterium sp. PL002]MBE0393707.1 hypothetical protein [Flavobacterium sp. PL002]
MDDADVDDYFYAFDKEDWTSKKYFENISKQKPDVIPGTNTCKEGSWDYAKNKCATSP